MTDSPSTLHELEADNRLLRQRIAELEEQQRAHETTIRALQSDVAMYTQAFDAVPDIVFVKDAESRVVYANKAFCDFHGLSPDEVRGTVDAAPHAPSGASSDEQVLATGQRFVIHQQSVTAHDGTARLFNTMKSPIRDAEGKVVQVVVVAHDITDRSYAESALKTSDERFRLLVDTLPIAFFMRDASGKLVYISPAYETIWGRTIAELEANPRAWIEAIHPDDLPETTKIFRMLSQTKMDFEYRIVRPDGGVRWISATSMPMRNAEGQTEQIVGFLADETERKQALIEQQQLQESMIQMQAATLAELSTPLIPISDRVVVLPLIGALDTQRTQQVLETLLNGVAERQAQIVIVDITGIKVVDTQVANTLIQAARAVRLLGARVMLTGIRPEVAHTLISLGVDLSDLHTAGTLQSGIAHVLS
ncbi:MAG TPA: PAS domain S-box protein [Herpetosiphonaceae bacterium]